MSVQRVDASGKNLRVSLFGHLMTVIFNFAVRRMFLGILGSEYTGFSGLCGHILNFLSLIEPGFDAACAFFLYKPLAYEMHDKVSAVMAYLSRVYRRVGIITFCVGLAALPFVLRLSGMTQDISLACTIYLLSLFEMSLSYFLIHRHVLPVSDQKSYTVNGIAYAIFILSRSLQLLLLVCTHSYIAYLVSGIAAGLVGEIILYCRIGKMYPYIKKAPPKLSDMERAEIVSKVRSLFFHKVGAIMCGSVDNMAVFIYLGLHSGTVYSNYTMLSGICLAIISILTGSVSASVGNLGVTEGRKRMQKVYSVTFFAIFALACFFAQSLFFVYPLAVRLWVGEEMVLDMGTSALFCTVMMISALRRPTGVFLDSFGLFEKEKYKALAEAALTLAATVMLAPRFGISGVLLGQLFGVLLFSFWYEPYILHKYGFRCSMSGFLSELFKYIFAFVLSLALSALLCMCCAGGIYGIYGIILRICLCGVSVGTVFLILFFDTKLLYEVIHYGKRVLGRS